jgi:beta-1,2-mannobiose phosphorylase / 1,2-beta-oligomannan phosphorylase
MIYHGVRRTPSSSIYRLGLALFDLQQPGKCLLRGDSWMFAPEAEYERQGGVQDVVFPCGYTVAPDGDTIHLYYGAADSSIALAHGSIRSLLTWLDANGHSEQSGDRRHKSSPGRTASQTSWRSELRKVCTIAQTDLLAL